MKMAKGYYLLLRNLGKEGLIWKERYDVGLGFRV